MTRTFLGLVLLLGVASAQAADGSMGLRGSAASSSETTVSVETQEKLQTMISNVTVSSTRPCMNHCSGMGWGYSLCAGGKCYCSACMKCDNIPYGKC